MVNKFDIVTTNNPYEAITQIAQAFNQPVEDICTIVNITPAIWRELENPTHHRHVRDYGRLWLMTETINELNKELDGTLPHWLTQQPIREHYFTTGQFQALTDLVVDELLTGSQVITSTIPHYTYDPEITLGPVPVVKRVPLDELRRSRL